MSKVITQQQLIEAIRTLGFDPNTILELHLFPTYAIGEEVAPNPSPYDIQSGTVTLEAGRVPHRMFHVPVVKEDA
ncbi:hypothetical protein [Brevibacterium casei]|uniref:Uncharacterized protein n=1 Tax=Brevibacterium casei CIP 102111 TaxID=1255625 RepID=A0A2H1IWV6_9MICO|nr:hypothetical protein [Brevibacterium casei]QPR39575.1 hypothetical protein I6G94_01370 [Brevibacterium casei]QPR43740.1 hypothetical protein I6G93_16660 [Brevibacterium casei]SMX79683.1 hypothetical protein BC102111_01675 [Brevibacterium casei CIP 102111]